MNFSKSGLWIVLISFVLLVPAISFAQTNCDEGAGPLDPAQPQGITTQEILQKMANREDMFREARNNYTYTQDITVQELDGNSVTGEYRLVQDITYSDKGERLENVTFAPQNSLRNLILTREDFEDFRYKMAFVMTTTDLPQYNVLYIGQQHVDEIDTYVFDTAPKTIEKGQRYFQGRIWIDKHDLQIVKSCGKTVPQTVASGKKKNQQENLMPKFVTYREQIDGQYWFPTYIRADDTLHFRVNGDVKMREIIKLTNYKRFGVSTKMVFKGEAKDDPKDDAKPAGKKP